MKKRIVFATAALVVPVVAGTLAAQNRLHPPLTSEQLAADRNHVAEVNARLNDPRVTAAYMNRMEELRLKWQDWAKEHREDLAEMLKEKGSQRSAFDRVQKSLPLALNHTAGAALTDADLDTPGLPFAYVPFFRTKGHEQPMPFNHTSHLGISTESDAPVTVTVGGLEYNRQQLHDIEIVTTMKPGHSFTLWASGRITEGGNVSHRLDEFRPGIIREVAPPYPFLTE